MLGIEPLELQLPVQLQRQISRSIQLSNVTDDCIAFRISTSSTLPYCIKPEKDIIPRQSCCEVTVTLDAKKAPDYKNGTTGEFYVESTRVDEGLTTANITDDMFREEADKVVDKVTLTVSIHVHHVGMHSFFLLKWYLHLSLDIDIIKGKFKYKKYYEQLNIN